MNPWGWVEKVEGKGGPSCHTCISHHSINQSLNHHSSGLFTASKSTFNWRLKIFARCRVRPPLRRAVSTWSRRASVCPGSTGELVPARDSWRA